MSGAICSTVPMVFDDDATFLSLAEALILADGILAPEEAAIAGWLRRLHADRPGLLADYQCTRVGEMDGADRRLLFEDLAVIAACDGDLAIDEAIWLTELGLGLGLPPSDVENLLDLAGRLADRLRDDPERFEQTFRHVDNLRVYLDELSSDTSSADQLASNGVAGAAAALPVGEAGPPHMTSLMAEQVLDTTEAAVTGDNDTLLENAADGVVSPEAIGAVRDSEFADAATEVGAEALSDAAVEVLVDAAGDALDGVPIIGGVVAAGGALRSLRDGDYKGAAESAAVTSTKVAAKGAAGAVAGAAASSIVYAGVGGTLLEAGVFLGLCATPASVVIAPIAAGGAAAVGVGYLYRKLRERR